MYRSETPADENTECRQAFAFVSQHGRMYAASPHARRWIAEFFGSTGTSAHVPQKLRRWLCERRGRPGQCLPLIQENSRAQLFITFLHPGADACVPLLLQLRECGTSSGRLRAIGLTARQIEILRLLDSGKSNKEIAAEIGITPSTVRTHLEQLYRKLNVNNRTAAAAVARESR